MAISPWNHSWRNTASGRPELFDPVCEFAMDDPR